MRTVLFFRDFRKFHGGHLKVWHYFSHVRSAPGHQARIAFTERSDWGEANPWNRAREDVVGSAADVSPDLFFVAGRDWQMMDKHPAAGTIPVVNFLQHVRHADPASNRYQFLPRRAIRICVSEVVAEAARATGVTEGPVMAIPNGVDLDHLTPSDPAATDIDVLIAGLKQPELGAGLRDRLHKDGRRLELLEGLLPRDEYLARVRRARCTVFLPNEAEGFYLPPLEGMAVGSLVVCPEHAGEHSIYRDGVNCARPRYGLEAVAEATESLLALDDAEAAAMRAEALTTASEHTLRHERRAFLDILERVGELW
ncbi:MAG: glycosyltransferase family protein [Solirubrobacterales bacterium]